MGKIRTLADGADAVRITYHPLLPAQRELQAVPPGPGRFRRYIDTILTPDRTGLVLAPLVAVNPMSKGHVTALLDALLALGADGIAAEAATEAAADCPDDSGEYDAAVVVADDLRGGWTNRFAAEYGVRFPDRMPTDRPRWLPRPWVAGTLWSSEPASVETVRTTVCAAVYRTAYLRRHGPARTLRAKLAQEGEVLARAGCVGPTLDPDDLAYTREVLVPLLDADDMPTTLTALFGDAAGATLGFPPLGLSPGAGLAVARAVTP